MFSLSPNNGHLDVFSRKTAPKMSLMTKRGKKTQLARTGLTFLLLLTIFVHVKFEVQPESTYSTVENDELARIPGYFLHIHFQ